MIWLFAHDALSCHTKKRFHRDNSDLSSRNTRPSFQTDRMDRAAVQTILAVLMPASHTIHNRVPRCPDLEYLLTVLQSSEMGFADNPPDNTVKIAMTIPTQIQNQPFVSHMFLTFQISLLLPLQPRGESQPSMSSNPLVAEGVFCTQLLQPQQSRIQMTARGLQTRLVAISRPAHFERQPIFHHSTANLRV